MPVRVKKIQADCTAATNSKKYKKIENGAGSKNWSVCRQKLSSFDVGWLERARRGGSDANRRIATTERRTQA
jgi:hypothetical protein